jgi:hypothetical protein
MRNIGTHGHGPCLSVRTRSASERPRRLIRASGFSADPDSTSSAVQRRRAPTHKPRWTQLAAFVPALLLVNLSAAPAADRAVPDWGSVVARYAEDPYRHRHALVALGGQATPALPPLILLALGDAQLRAMRLHGAEESFTYVLAQGASEPYAGWARLGLAWAALARRDHEGARARFATLAESESSAALLGEFALGFIEAADERPTAFERFAHLATDERAPPLMQQAARLGAAYAHYWSGAYGEASDLLAALAEGDPASALADDARYGAAWARWHAGDHTGAASALRELAAGQRETSSGDRRRPSRILANLEPQALLQAGVERYRRAPFAPPESLVALIVNGDGVALARAALRRGIDARPGEVDAWARPPLTAWHVSRAPEAGAADAARTTAPARLESPARWQARWVVVIVTIAAVLVLVRMGSKTGPRVRSGSRP